MVSLKKTSERPKQFPISHIGLVTVTVATTNSSNDGGGGGGGSGSSSRPSSNWH